MHADTLAVAMPLAFAVAAAWLHQQRCATDAAPRALKQSAAHEGAGDGVGRRNFLLRAPALLLARKSQPRASICPVAQRRP